jgi:hypothetical protein
VRFTDEQLSMVLSALAGDQPLCCERHALNRESIARTPEQLAVLADWADRNTGCRLGEGLINMAQWRIIARERYLNNVKHLEMADRSPPRLQQSPRRKPAF